METNPWGTVINPLWAVLLEKVEEAWRSTGSLSRPTSPSSLPQAQLGYALFPLQPSPERCAQASLEETVKWTENRSVFENKNVARLFLEREDTQAPHEESVKGHDPMENMPFSLTSSLEATWKSIFHEIAPIQRSTPGGYSGQLHFFANGENRKSLCHYWGDRSMGSISRPSSPSSLPQAQWGSASFALQPSPKRCAQASLGETDK